MRIGILGSGNVGGNLGVAWSRAGHEVVFGTREPAGERVGRLVEQAGGGARAGTIASAADHGDVVVLALPFAAIEDVLRAAGPLDGRIVVDAMNDFAFDAQGVRVASSSMAHLRQRLPQARLVKAFNTVGAEHLLDPSFAGVAADLYVATDDADAGAAVRGLAADIGFDPVDAGPLGNATLLEHLAVLWIHLAVRSHLGRGIAFKLLRKT